MVTVVYGPCKCPDDVYLKSTDAKPTNVCNASRCYEMDTGKLFLFDAETKTWLEV